jgi:hypothetical protein
MKSYFVDQHSIVRQIWGKADTVLFIFAGAAAEFALNKAVDWLYFTGKLPADPLGRLFSTVTYSRQILFAENDEALAAIDRISKIHSGVEQARGSQIPQWAYRDVLFMLIHYSISSFEVLERPLTIAEKEEVFDVFCRVGDRMGITDLPENYAQWLSARDGHMKGDMIKGHFTLDLYHQYRKHLGVVRYFLLKQVQALICPQQVKAMLGLRALPLLRPVLWLYRTGRAIKLDRPIKVLLLPSAYKMQIAAIDR